MGVNRRVRKFKESPIGDALAILGYLGAGLALVWVLVGKKATPQRDTAKGRI